MAIPARLSGTLHSVLGDEGADDLVNWMSQVDSNQSELRELTIWAARADVRFDNIEARLSRVDERLDNVEKGLADLRVEIKDSMAGLESRLNTQMTDLFKWSFAFWCGAIGVEVLTLLLK